MTNNNRVGSNVDLFCKLYYNFDQNGPGQGWFDPPLLFSRFVSLLFSSSLFFKLYKLVTLQTLVLYINVSAYYERRRLIPLWSIVSKTSTNPEDSWKKVKNANGNQSIFSIDVQKSLSFKRELLKFHPPGPRLIPVGWWCQKQEKRNHDRKSDKVRCHNARWQQISRNQKLVQSTPNRLRRINHINSLEAGCKLRQTSTRAKSFLNDSYS